MKAIYLTKFGKAHEAFEIREVADPILKNAEEDDTPDLVNCNASTPLISIEVLPSFRTLKISELLLFVTTILVASSAEVPPFTFNLPVGEFGAPIFSRTLELSHAKLDEAANDPAGVELN